MPYIEVKDIIFKNKQNIPWSDVEKFLRRYDGFEIENKEFGDVIHINAVFADEYVHSQYTRKLRGALAKTKANLAQVIPQIVKNATNRRWVENKDDKHKENAIGGWYRYDIQFSMRVQDPQKDGYSLNFYNGTMIVRINDKGMYLHDIINIKKEARKPTDP